ncbi:HNH endonuclease [Lysobacter sp. CA199]|uniref:HNH endonuclease n=1 Tax=Lysobacter sp. CA199 TaxID=3455608 RepID=UPI003F8D70E0
MNAPRQTWTDDQLETLRINYANWPTYLVAFVCGHSETSTYQKAKQLGLRKSAEFLSSSASGRLQKGDLRGTSGRYPKGHVPANKGLRRPGWAPGRMAATQFKAGRPTHEARNYLPIGTERVNADGYLERKVSDDQSVVPARRWVGVHRLVWEAANGPVPSGHAIAFRPGRRSVVAAEITLDALELVSRAQLGARNIFHNRYPKDVCQLIQLKGALNRKINRRNREKLDG